ncbi:replication protein [Stutzerimonas decontaminans]|uniref:Replication protein n=1 Tax=Stutzerimonas decontaminans TaxID=3022791 RepID=A0ABX4VRH6_9GAMM|nr:protein rep [Stutzerimonas decontaminans]MCQ4243425.1 protein rep [Stutzerimonas decontaminans]PNF82800.1 replication protein [Stutzerimonas decontaminans]
MNKSNTVTDSAQKPGGFAPLGIYAKTEAAHEVVNHETGEITRFKVDSKSREHVQDIDPRHFRWERFALKSVVNRLLPTSRTSKCCRWRVPKQALQVHRSTEHGKAFYSGLQVCASVWACPVCAAKISERRRAELVTAVALAKSMGMHVKLLTLTVPHGLGDDLPTLLVQIRNAWRRTTTGRAGKGFRKLLGIKGTIRALEVTHGQNGFHPHLHVLLFLEQDATNGCIQGLFTPIWQDACTKAGLPRPSDAHGCRVDDGSKAAAYASKWGLESELTKSHTKKGRNGSRTPWDFLRAFLDKSEGWEQSAHLFRTYADAFKGQRQLYWSNGLRALLALGEEATDEEVAATQEDNARVLAELTDEQWRAILVTKSETAVLDMAEQHPEALPVMLASILKRSDQLRALNAAPA